MVVILFFVVIPIQLMFLLSLFALSPRGLTPKNGITQTPRDPKF